MICLTVRSFLTSQFFLKNQHRLRGVSSFILSVLITFCLLALVWDVVSSRPVSQAGTEFSSFTCVDENNRKKENTVRLMMRQKVSTPKKSKSTFRAKTVSDIIAPEPDFNLEVAKIAPSVTPSQLQECNIGRNLDFSVFKTGNFLSRLTRAGAKKGYMTVSLMWDNYNDLDLHCTGPNREEIFYDNRKGKIGELDVDMNAANQLSLEPVENLYFPQRVKGKYQIHVNHYSNKGGKDPTYFQVLVRIEGQKPMKFKGAISAGEPKKEIYATHLR